MKGYLKFRKWVTFGSLCGILLWTVSGMAETVIVQTTGHQSSAIVGSGGNATIDILITSPLTGAPVDTLGGGDSSVIGDGTSQITLPIGWVLNTVTGPVGNLIPTQFFNPPSPTASTVDGTYSIKVQLPSSAVWPAGEWIYVIEINETVGTTTFRGSGMGVLTIK